MDEQSESCLDAAYVIGLILRLLNPPECRVTPTSAQTAGAMAEDGPDGRTDEVESVDDETEKDSEQARCRFIIVVLRLLATVRSQVEAGCLLWDLAANPAMSEVMHVRPSSRWRRWAMRYRWSCGAGSPDSGGSSQGCGMRCRAITLCPSSPPFSPRSIMRRDYTRSVCNLPQSCGPGVPASRMGVQVALGILGNMCRCAPYLLQICTGKGPRALNRFRDCTTFVQLGQLMRKDHQPPRPSRCTSPGADVGQSVASVGQPVNDVGHIYTHTYETRVPFALAG